MRLEPFLGYRYDDPGADASIALGVMDLTSVVTGPDEIAEPTPTGYGVTRFIGQSGDDALAIFHEWLNEGVVSRDATPSLYLYRSGVRDSDGVFRQGSGVIGVSGSSPSASQLDHVPSVVRVDSPELSELLGELTGQPLARATDTSGVHHRLWAITAMSMIEAVNDSIVHSPDPAEGTLVAVTPDDVVPPTGLVFNVTNGH